MTVGLTIHHLSIGDPTGWSEPVGAAVRRVGGVVVPSEREGISVSAPLELVSSAVSETAAEREAIRRAFRSMVHNPLLRSGVWVAWSEDGEQDGWYVLGAGSIDLPGSGALASSWWTVGGLELALVGRDRTHRRASVVEAYDRRLATVPVDIEGRTLSAEFDGFTGGDDGPVVWLPSAATDVVVTSTDYVPLTAARVGQGGAQLQGMLAPSHMAVASFEQSAGHRNAGAVRAYDRRGDATAPTTGPADAWEEALGTDWPWYDATSDAPVIENGLARCRFAAGAIPGVTVDTWTGSAWLEVGTFIVKREGGGGESATWLNTLVRAELVELSPEVAVVRMVLGSDLVANARERLYVTLQRGWRGPRVEVYAAPRTDGADPADLYLWLEQADAGGMVVTRSSGSVVATESLFSTTPAVVGAGVFTSGEPWLAVATGDGTPLALVPVLESHEAHVVQTSAARNAVGVATSTGYAGLQLAAGGNGGDALEAEAMTLASGTTATSDGTASGGSAASATRTAEADHVTTTVATSGAFRVLARVRNATSGTLNIRAQTAAETGSTVTTTSTTYAWVNLGEISANDADTLRIRAWRSSAGTFYVDRVVLLAIEDRGDDGAWDGARDAAVAAMWDSIGAQRIVPRSRA